MSHQVAAASSASATRRSLRRAQAVTRRGTGEQVVLSSLRRRSARYKVPHGVGAAADRTYEEMSGHALLREDAAYGRIRVADLTYVCERRVWRATLAALCIGKDMTVSRAVLEVLVG